MAEDRIAVTGGGQMFCKNIIHMKARSHDKGWKEGIFRCLEKVEKLNWFSVSFPCLGTGKSKLKLVVLRCVIFGLVIIS